mmetsp:Transcript_16076/g.36914  ORF Transcript_16076/g.36914 Transcript_16076/m.36914 type:complete len:102 (-) Transcript_16076:36-341(-)
MTGEIGDLKRRLDLVSSKSETDQVEWAKAKIMGLKHQLESLRNARTEAKRANEQLSRANEQIKALKRQLETKMIANQHLRRFRRSGQWKSFPRIFLEFKCH